ncbi:hypothetical protein [Stenoxybacter acetivorans]|uniref:hypothetical protein n=1 Tax=Stenoxybacter acetivorans TaxID=422441 RepID=UPI0012EC72B9|nr:hypothetical protein [Stenoxybacter acetivorans]
MKKYLLLSSILLILTACASTATKSPPPTREQQLKYQAYQIQNNYDIVQDETKTWGDKGQLRVVAGLKQGSQEKPKDDARYVRITHRSHAVQGNALKAAAFVLSILAPSGYSHQSNTKYDLYGDALDGVDNQSLNTIYTPIKNYLFEQYGGKADKEYFPFLIAGKQLYLVYDKFTQDSKNEYQLVSEISFEKNNEDLNGRFVFNCQQSNAVKPLAEWEADNYKAVHEVSQQYAEKCADILLTARRRQLAHSYAEPEKPAAAAAAAQKSE